MPYKVYDRKGDLVAVAFVTSLTDDLRRIARMVSHYGTGLTFHVADSEGDVEIYSLSDLFDVVRMDDRPTLCIRVDGTTEYVSPYDGDDDEGE